MKALITGVSGFVGSFLSEELLANNFEVVGLSRTPSSNKNIEYRKCDILDEGKLKQILQEVKPDHIYHLAGSAFIPISYERPIETYRTIVNGTLSLYEIIRNLEIDSKVLYVGSAEVYGIGKGVPFTEEDLFHPTNPYAGAKAAADVISEQYAKAYNMKIIRVRPFNHTGPKQSSEFVCSNFAKQIALLENEGKQNIRVGNINVSRDFLDVRDVVHAYLLLMKHGKVGEVYNVSSNKSVSIGELLNSLLLFSNIQNPTVEIDSSKVRKKDTFVRVGDSTKLQGDTGWYPKHDLKDTMRDLLAYWREHSFNS
ncbi:GDP-mannose 4,6-dehydratase [Paenibacillus algorifonticola]|uniref:GDP-mannose 4,6-dehydratase n=1 Tax=Paenibacillus algorifonticola TaxID=684063 RepID=UPI003D26D62B